MTDRKTHRFRPAVDRLEPLCLLSAGLRGPALVHQNKVVDLRTTPIGADALAALSQATPSEARRSISLDSLTANDKNRKVTGSASATYDVGGPLTAQVRFTTSIDRPRVQDVKVSMNRRPSLITAGQKAQVARAVVNFLKADRAQISAALTK